MKAEFQATSGGDQAAFGDKAHHGRGEDSRMGSDNAGKKGLK